MITEEIITVFKNYQALKLESLLVPSKKIIFLLDYLENEINVF